MRRKTNSCIDCGTPIKRESTRCQPCRRRYCTEKCLANMVPPNPDGLCMCGCGRKTKIATRTSGHVGHIQGHPICYIKGHNALPRHLLNQTWVVDEKTGCWNWQGSTSAGYAIASIQGKAKIRIHRLVYEARYGPIPDGLVPDHLCRNRGCVNPDHLEPVTPAENARRGARARLTMEKARKIRELAPTMSRRELQAMFDVSYTTIKDVIAGTKWWEEGQNGRSS